MRDDAVFDLALDGRQLGAEVGLRGEDDERGVEAAHQDQREPRVAVAEIELIVALIEGVVEGAIQLPGAERAAAIELLGFPFQASGFDVVLECAGRCLSLPRSAPIPTGAGAVSTLVISAMAGLA